MDKKTIKHLISLLRQGTITWYIRNQALNRDRELRLVGQRLSGKPKYKYFYKCQGCKEFTPHKELLEVDHIEAIGHLDISNPKKIDWSRYLYRMYCDLDNLQALCNVCHKRKTSKGVASLRFQRKGDRKIWDESEEMEEIDFIPDPDL